MDVQMENEIVMRPINTIKPYVRNPRRNSKTVDMLCKIIPKVGFNVPIVIDEKGIIVKGHARFTAAIRLGMNEVPCIVSHADPEAIKADRIADNKISEFSQWVDEDLMNEINDMEFDLSDIGLPKINFDEVPTIDDLKHDDAPQLSEATVAKIAEEFASDHSEEEIKAIQEEYYNKAYYKCVCDKCGYTMFIEDGKL